LDKGRLIKNHCKEVTGKRSNKNVPVKHWWNPHNQTGLKFMRGTNIKPVGWSGNKGGKREARDPELKINWFRGRAAGENNSGECACSSFQKGGLFLLDIGEELDVGHILKAAFPTRRVVCDRESIFLSANCKPK
jgi:hypothetical protein